MLVGCITAGLVVTVVPKEPVPANVALPSKLESLANQAPTEPSLIRSLPLPLVETVQSTDMVAHRLDAVDEQDKWQTVKVRRGDNLSLIAKHLGLSAQIVHRIMTNPEAAVLKNLRPGQELHILLEDGMFRELIYDIDLTHSLHIRRADERFTSEMLITELETRIATAAATITSSLFLAAQNAGLSDNLTMQLVHLFGWDIDFALNIREGDSFALIYEEQFKDGEKLKDGPILAAEFINRNKTYRAVRYTNRDGHTDYFADSGHSMRKAFLRTPLDFQRISSRFSLKRKHPILNRIRAHRGVDYAAPNGTPVKATGDGIVVHAGRKGSYGNTIILKHGGKYSTVYAHLSRITRGIKRGKRVSQGQAIGYVGTTGLATGPHLHYEFRINGVHRNPLTVTLPKAMQIPAPQMGRFKATTRPMLAQLGAIAPSYTSRNLSSSDLNTAASTVAMQDGMAPHASPP